MIKRTETFLKQLVLFVDVVAIATAFVSTYFLRQYLHNVAPDSLALPAEWFTSLKDLDSYLWLLLVILPVWTSILQILGGYRELRVKSYVEIISILIKCNIFGLICFGAIVFLFKLDYVSRSFMALFFLISGGLLCLERALLIQAWHLMSDRLYFRRSILIVGTGPRARSFITAIQGRVNVWGLRIVGFIDKDQTMVGRDILGYKVIGTLDGLPRLLRKRIVDEVIYVVPRSWISRIEQSILYCESVGVRATIAADLFNMRVAKAHLTDLDGMPAISFDPTPADQWQLAMKRLLDISTAALALIVLSPLFLTVAILIRRTSPGPIFFKQTRCGINGRRFTLFKFRSMIVGAHAKRNELNALNEMKGPVFKMANDPRLTPLGRWLRKTSIDELPQLFNVLVGEMSIVGPRPPIPQEVSRYEPWQRRRLSMRPGITGNWQVSGRNNVSDFNLWTEMDLEYIDRWSILLDVKIILKTIPAVLFGSGAK
jgi:exopolysaccharide biosynthesis polyprenyl glycosylphosphotransferase